MVDFGIVIVNWNTRDLLKRCLDTVFAGTGKVTYRVVVVDNGSEDGSDEMVAECFPQVVLLSGHGNVGYPAGNNLGLRSLGYVRSDGTTASDAPRYAMLLNPDTEIPPDALFEMLQYLDAHPEVGIAGPKLVLVNGKLDLACRRSFPTPEVAFWRMLGFSKLFPKSRRFARYNLTYLDEDEVSEVDSVVGASMVVRREAIEQVGLLDETFFMYGEDLDWCKRIKEAGWKVLYYPRVQITHVKRAASRQSKRAQYEFVRAFLLFYSKHYRDQTPWIVHVAVLMSIALQGGPRLWPEVFIPSRLPDWRGG
ncbi:MAG: glycosyltransferase family 2 protein [Anaerolineae bacterium]|nr:glycosyltransferase family 2 protein [Anaerolineae bacterium]